VNGWYEGSPENGFHCATLDGVCEPFGGYHYTSLNWWPAKGRMVGMYARQEYVYEPRAGVQQWCGPYDQPFLEGEDDFPLSGYPYVKLTDRWINFSNGYIRAKVQGQPFVPEGPQFPYQFHGGVVAGRSNTDVCVTGATGCIFYDSVNKVISSKRYYPGIPSGTVFYATEHQVFISYYFEDLQDGMGYGLEDCIRIWSMEVEPAVLTAPVLIAGTARAGQVVTYQVRLTGDTSMVWSATPDGCENEIIEWSLTGAGVLLDVQSVTDAEGYATARVQYRVGETGDSTVTASVQC
jgi:hypothetical protein